MYETKGNSYFANVRKPLLDLIPKENLAGNILEIGAGSGDTLLYAKQNGYAKEIYAIELMNLPNSNQQSEEFKQFIIGNIENLDFDFEDEMFDVIIMGDVLEHLVDPWSIVKKLKKYLKTNGVCIASIANVRNLKTFRNIFLRGSFRYEDIGIFDKTHLRFFTKKDMIQLFEDGDYKIVNIKSSLDFKAGSVAMKNKLTFGLFEEFLAKQYYIVACNDLKQENDKL
jgi:2-polyprenyl-3-methyl-5-hydroxy-6-metoxy-1,4-benzoquinol methylase